MIESFTKNMQDHYNEENLRTTKNKTNLKCILSISAVLIMILFLVPNDAHANTSPSPSTISQTGTDVIVVSGSGRNLNCGTTCFQPSTIITTVGSPVIFKNNDTTSHTFTSGTYPTPSGLFDSGLISPGKTYSFTFQTSGIFKYYDKTHPWMKGQITVQGSTSSIIVIPSWIKKTTRLWYENKIDDSTFSQLIRHLVNNKIIVISNDASISTSSIHSIPSWVKDDAILWSQGKIDDKTFVSAIQYLSGQVPLPPNSLGSFVAKNNAVQASLVPDNPTASWGSYGISCNNFNNPSGIAVDNSGDVYVSDTNNNCIQEFDSSGKLIEYWGSYGTALGQLNHPTGLAIDSSGNVYVIDSGNNRIQEFHLLPNIFSPKCPGGSKVPISSGPYTVCNVESFGSYGLGNGQIQNPTSIGVDSSGNVYVSDSDNSIKEFDGLGIFLASTSGSAIATNPTGVVSILDGTQVYPIALTGICPPEFVHVKNNCVSTTMTNVVPKVGKFGYTAVETDSSNHIYLVDSDYDRIIVFDQDGYEVTSWGGYGSGKGQFKNPAGIAIDSSDNVYVIDSTNNNLQKFGPVK